VEVSTLDHSDQSESERIGQILRESYAVEAEWIGADDFPPLRRRSSDIRKATSTFYGVLSAGRLVAVAEVEATGDETANIAGLVVHPNFFRQGFGSRLLQHVLTAVPADSFTVSTAAANRPALALYEKHGFHLRRRWATHGIDMVTLERSTLPPSTAGTGGVAEVE
jgi:ribosomal protein S18 acetylase RimI-like enzyme